MDGQLLQVHLLASVQGGTSGARQVSTCACGRLSVYFSSCKAARTPLLTSLACQQLSHKVRDTRVGRRDVHRTIVQQAVHDGDNIRHEVLAQVLEHRARLAAENKGT